MDLEVTRSSRVSGTIEPEHWVAALRLNPNEKAPQFCEASLEFQPSQAQRDLDPFSSLPLDWLPAVDLGAGAFLSSDLAVLALVVPVDPQAASVSVEEKNIA